MGSGIYRTHADYTDTIPRIMRSALRCPGEGLRNGKVLGGAERGGDLQTYDKRNGPDKDFTKPLVASTLGALRAGIPEKRASETLPRPRQGSTNRRLSCAEHARCASKLISVQSSVLRISLLP